MSGVCTVHTFKGWSGVYIQYMDSLQYVILYHPLLPQHKKTLWWRVNCVTVSTYQVLGPSLKDNPSRKRVRTGSARAQIHWYSICILRQHTVNKPQR